MHVKVEFTEGYEKRFTESCCRMLARRERQGIIAHPEKEKKHPGKRSRYKVSLHTYLRDSHGNLETPDKNLIVLARAYMSALADRQRIEETKLEAASVCAVTAFRKSG